MHKYRTTLALLMLCALTVLPPLTAQFATPAHAASGATATLFINQAVMEGETLLAQNKADEAYTLFMRLLREEPQNARVNVGLYKAALASGRTNQALSALERLVDMHPQDSALRTQLVQLYARTGNMSEAKREVEEMRKHDPAASAETSWDEAESLLRKLEKQNSRFQYSGKLSAGVVYDSNANAGLNGREISLGMLRLTLDNNSQSQAAFGEYLNFAFNGAYRLGEASPWWLVGDTAYYGKVYNKDLPSNQNFGWGRMSAGLRRLGQESMIDVRVKGESAIYNPNEAANIVGPELTYAFVLTDWLQSLTQAGWESRTYFTDQYRNGAYYHAGQFLRFLWGGKDGSRGHSLLVGGRYLGSSTNHDRYSYDGWEALVRANFWPLEKLEVTPFVSYRQLQYRAAPTLLEEVLGEPQRNDSVWQTGLFVAWHWTENLSTEIGWQYLKNHSSSPLYRYDQHVMNMGMTFTF